MHISGTRLRNAFRSGHIGLLAAVLIVLAAGWAVGETAALYLRIRCVPVRSEASFEKGDTKATAVAGQSFTVLERSKDGEWVKVQYLPDTREEKKAEPVEGWVHATVLTEKPLPAERDEHCTWVREGAKALPQAGAVVKEHAAKRRQDPKPVLDAEALYPSEKELDTFLKDGDLGVYRSDWPSLEGGLTQ